MGSIIISYNNKELIDEMARSFSKRSTQGLIDFYENDMIKVYKFARLNGTGTKLYRDADGNILGLVGFAGIEWEDGNGFNTTPSELLFHYLRLQDETYFIEHIWGNFIIIIYLQKLKTLKIIRDFGNSYNFYCAARNNGYYLSNSALALAEHIKTKHDHQGIANYFTFISLFDDQCLFQGIKKMAPSTLYTYSPDGRVAEKAYGKLPPDVRTENSDIEFYAGMFDKAIRLTAACTQKPSVDVTGGYDSRLIVASAIHSGMDFLGCVHGEDDAEVGFVLSRIATPLKLSCEVLKIGRGAIPDFSKYSLLCHYLFDGCYSIFDATKEGLRSIQRMSFSDAKVAGGLGEYLRDKWYGRFYKYRKSKVLRNKLLDYLTNFFCRNQSGILLRDIFTKDFLSFILGGYQQIVRDKIANHYEYLTSKDLSYLYIYPVYLHYVRGWLGELYNGHNRILLTSAPYLMKQIAKYGLTIPYRDKKYANIQVKMINYPCPLFSKINFITGMPCKTITPQNIYKLKIAKGKYFIKLVVSKASDILLGKKIATDYKFDYDYRLWLEILLKDEYIRDLVMSVNSPLNDIINRNRIENILKHATSVSIPIAHYRTISRFISLAITSDITKH